MIIISSGGFKRKKVLSNIIYLYMKKMECTEKQVVIFDEQVRFLYIAIPITTQRFPTVRNGWLC